MLVADQLSGAELARTANKLKPATYPLRTGHMVVSEQVRKHPEFLTNSSTKMLLTSRHAIVISSTSRIGYRR